VKLSSIVAVIVTACALLAAPFYCTGAGADDEAANCNEHPLASLPLYFAPDGAMATDVDIGAPQPLEFRIDLIGGNSELRDDVAAALQLRREGVPRTAPMIYKSGHLIEHRAVVPHVRLGSVDAGEIKAYLLPSPSSVNALAPAVVVGTLGSDVFNQYDVELDLAHGTMNLFPPAPCELPLPARSNSARVTLDNSSGGPTILILIDGKEVKGDIRTASCCSHMNMNLANSRFDLDTSTPGVTVISGAAGPTAYNFNFGNLVIGGVSMPNPRIALVAPYGWHSGMRVNGWSTQCVSCEHVQLGLRELIHFHLYFAFEKRTLFVAPVVQ
jgi:hypothetical protein